MGLLKKISVKFQSQFSPPTPPTPPQASSSTSSPVPCSPRSTGARKITLATVSSSTSPATASSDLSNNGNSNRNSGSRDIITNAPALNDNNNFNSWPRPADASPSHHTSPVPVTSNCSKFVPGDRVKVIKNVHQLRVMQEGHGGWNVKMIKLPFTVGTVHRITVSGNIRVRFGDDITSPKFTINADALAFAPETYRIGDTILVDDDVKRVKLLQKDHGEWIDQMECIIGKVGSIIALDEDNDLQVLFDCQRVYTLNPMSVSLASPSPSSLHDSSETSETSVASIYPSLKSLSSQLQMKTHVDEYACFNSGGGGGGGGSHYSAHCISVTERLKLLEDKFSEIEEVYSCNICMERVRKVVFMCGHGTCIKCSHSLTSCHMCRLPITRKIHLY